MKKILLGIFIALLIVCIIVEGVFLYKAQNKLNSKDTNQETVANENNEISYYNGERITIFEKINKNVPKADDDFGIRPFDAYTYKYYNVLDEWTGYEYYIPQIYLNEINSEGKNLDDITKINSEILKEWEDTINNIKQNQAMDMCKEGLEYRCYYDDNIMTLLLKTSVESGYSVLKSYTIDGNTGKEISNKELIKKFGLTEDEVKTKLINIIDKFSKDTIEKFEQQDNEDNYYKTGVERAKKQVRETEIEDMELIIVGDNQLGVYIETFNLYYAGGDGSGFLFNLETGEEILFEY